jgi:hypothetical protein
VSGDDEHDSIVIDDPVGPRTRTPTDTAAPAAPVPPRRIVPPEIVVRRDPNIDPDDTGPLLILRERTVIDRQETPPVADPLADAPTPAHPVPAHRSGPFGPPIPVESTPPPRPRAPSSSGRRPLPRESSRPRAGGARPVRDYPVLRGLVHDPDAHLEERATSTAVPRAFVRAGPASEPRSSARADVDGMLEEMAEGLLVGGDGAGTSEIRVTLGEEFFGGTELRIQRNADGVTAILRPPDRETYRILAGELPRLRVHLEERGLRVSNLRVEEP